VGEQVGVGVEVVEVEVVVLVVVLVLLVLAHARDVVKLDAQQVTVIARNRSSGAQVLIPCNASATRGGGNRA
jgi:hypothetical protein